MDGLDGFGALPPRLPRNFQPRVEAWMRDHATQITAVTGLAPANNPHVNIVDRSGMTDALVGVADTMMDKLPAEMKPGIKQGSWFMRQATRAVVGMLSKNVLGLYVPAYQAGAKDPALYVVGANVERVAAEIGVKPESLAHYVTFHEATHQWQFTAHPWLNAHMESVSMGMLDASKDMRPADLLKNLVVNGGDLTKAVPGLAAAQATMSLVEGYADFMTEQLGISRDPELAKVAEALAGRRKDGPAEKPSVAEELIQKIMGMDAKKRQYSEGKRFCEVVHAAGGHPLLNKVWTSPATLPTAREMAKPELWVARMSAPGGQAAA